MKLAAKLILVFLLGVLAIVSLFAWQTIRRQQAWEQQRRELHAVDLVDAAMPEIKRAHQFGGTVTIRNAIEVSSRTLGGYEMRWVDGKQVPIQTTTRRISSLSVTNSDGTRTSYSYVPVNVDGDEAGAIEVTQSMDENDLLTKRSVIASLVSLGCVSLLSAGVIYFGGVRLIGRPLDKLIAHVNAIGEGKLGLPPVLTSNDELGKLATAISQMSHRLSEQRQTIRHADRLGTIGTLSAGIAHELGTPLNVVSGRAGLIASGNLSVEDIKSSALTIKSEAERMTAIIRKLLDFAHQAPSPHEAIDIGDIVHRTTDLMRSLATKSEVEFELDVPEDPIWIAGDTAQIQQVLTNLITNAIAAMPGGGTMVVTLSEEKNSRQVNLRVADTGSGIDSKDLPHIFEPFYTTKDIGQGTGLGLSIAYGIIKEHGGSITVQSTPGKQTTFEVSFPACSAEPKE